MRSGETLTATLTSPPNRDFKTEQADDARSHSSTTLTLTTLTLTTLTSTTLTSTKLSPVFTLKAGLFHLCYRGVRSSLGRLAIPSGLVDWHDFQHADGACSSVTTLVPDNEPASAHRPRPEIEFSTCERTRASALIQREISSRLSGLRESTARRSSSSASVRNEIAISSIVLECSRSLSEESLVIRGSQFPEGREFRPSHQWPIRDGFVD